MNRRRSIVAPAVALILLLAACGADAGEQGQLATVEPTSVATTAPISMPTPTSTPVPTPTSVAVPEATATPIPVPTPTVAEATPAPTVEPEPTAVADAEPAVADAATPTPEVIETPTPAPTPTTVVETEEEPTPTPVAETPTAVVVASGEPPLECYDPVVQLYRAHVDGVDALSFEGGRVYCTGAGTNAVSAAASYRHSTGLIVQRNADYIFKDDGSGYIPHSGFIHFCIDGQAASGPWTAENVASMLYVIDGEAQRHVAQGATAPVAFSGTSQC